MHAHTHTHTPRHWVCPAHLTPTRAGWKHLGGVSPGSIDAAVLVRRGKHGESECEQRVKVRGDFKKLNLALRSGWRRGWVVHSRQGHGPKKARSRVRQSTAATQYCGEGWVRRKRWNQLKVVLPAWQPPSFSCLLFSPLSSV